MLTLISQGALVCLVAQSCLTLCDPMDCSPPGSSVRGILQARILEWVAVPFSRISSQTMDRTRVSRTAGESFMDWATRESTEVSFCDIAGLRVLIVKRKVKVAQSCAPLYDPTDCVVMGNTEASFCIWQFSSNIWSKRGLAVWSKSSCGPVSIPWPKLFIYFSTFANETFNLMCMHTL